MNVEELAKGHTPATREDILYFIEENIDYSGLDTSFVKDMSNLFREKKINYSLKDWSFMSAETTEGMFFGAKLTKNTAKSYTRNELDLLDEDVVSYFGFSKKIEEMIIKEDKKILPVFELKNIKAPNLKNVNEMFKDFMFSVDMSGFEAENLENIERMFSVEDTIWSENILFSLILRDWKLPSLKTACAIVSTRNTASESGDIAILDNFYAPKLTCLKNMFSRII